MNDEVLAELAAYDDDALALLSNKGLVRRAAKDLEKATPEITGDAVRVEEATVTLVPGGPLKARCTCPARDVCRHIIAACLWLRGAASAGIETAPATITGDDILRWSGTRTARAAADLTPTLGRDGEWTTAHFPEIGETARFLPSRPFDSALCTCKSGVCAHAVAAVMAFFEIGPELSTPAPGITHPPRTRGEILAATVRLFEEMLAVGLSQLSDSTCQRAATLAVSAHGVDLPRLASLLRTVADEIALMLTRDARADSSRLLWNVARAFALCSALPANPGLAGVHRTRYDEVRALELHGLGAYVWQTSSGYSGLTLLFWSDAMKDWLTWSEARPATQLFDPRARFFGESPWTGIASAHALSRAHVRLLHARRNGQNRLSASSKSIAVTIGATDPRALDFSARAFDDWAALRAYAQTILPLGLQTPRATSAYVVIKPHEWGRPFFDAIRQQLRRPLGDARGAEVLLCTQFREGDESAVRMLESFDAAKAEAWGVVARLTIADELLLWPVSILTNIVPSIRFVDLPEATTDVPAPAPRAPEEQDVDEAGETDLLPPSLHPVADVVSALDALAERGTTSIASALRDRLLAASHRSGAIGLRHLESEASAFSRASDPRVRAERLLRLRYLADVARQAALRASVE